MTYKQIEASREARLWIGQIIVPAVTTTAAILMTNPEIRQKAAQKAIQFKYKIQNKFKRD